MENQPINIEKSIKTGIQNKKPIVALESAVITHGLPKPTNLELAIELENHILNQGAIPATTAFINGVLRIGLNRDELHTLANIEDSHKISKRDFGLAAANQWYGGTTVAGTLIAAKLAGIKVFATGGIGGVHRGNIYDISADLQELAQSPVVVVCAGAKSILDLPATLEVLETMGVPVIGYQTNEFPAFYAQKSGLKTHFCADSPDQIAEIFINQQKYGLNNSILVVNPIPDEFAVDPDEMENHIQKALEEASFNNITGSRVTPFLLSKIAEITQGKSLSANLALLKNNALLASEIAKHISKKENKAFYV